MTLKEQIQSDLLESMKQKNDIKTGALRMLKASILKFEVSGKEKIESSDEDILVLISKEIKQRKDSAEQFKAGNRIEMAEKEEKEIEILQEYLPKQASDDEIKLIVSKIIKDSGEIDKPNIGKIMGLAMSQLKGKADGNRVKNIVSMLLN